MSNSENRTEGRRCLRYSEDPDRLRDKSGSSEYLRHRRPLSSLHSSFIIHHSSFRPAYTLVELFLTLAVLMVVLGMMINLSNRVRRESADKVTRQMLSRLTVLMAQYKQENDDQLPPITQLIDSPQMIPQAPNESELLVRARQNNADFCRYLRLDHLVKHSGGGDGGGDDPLAGALVTSGSQPLLEDPWGSPIVFMPGQNPAIGLPPRDAFFFFSAGPDRLFLTKEDNFYSYEETTLGRE